MKTIGRSNPKPSLVPPESSLDKPELPWACQSLPWTRECRPGSQKLVFLKKYKNRHHAPDLGPAQSFSCGFSRTPRCIQTKHHTHIQAHKKREPKRIDQSRDINETPSIIPILFYWVWACCLPWLSYIFSCLYSIPL